MDNVLADIPNLLSVHQYLEELRDGRLAHYEDIISDLRFKFNLTEEEGKAVLNQWFNQYGKV